MSFNCPHCNQPTGTPDWKANDTTLWANQHGRLTRVFCYNCGAWHDITENYRTGLTTIRVVHSPTPEGE